MWVTGTLDVDTLCSYKATGGIHVSAAVLGNEAPILVRRERGGVCWWTDPAAAASGFTIAFSERAGGVSTGPYASLNLAAHVDDDPEAVDANRDRLLAALDMSEARTRLTMAEQVHGDRVVVVDAALAGAGAYAASGAAPVPRTDALVSTTPGVPLLLCFADCVPVILATRGGVAVAHSGWRGALAGIAGATAVVLADETRSKASDVVAWIGPHIGACHYGVGDEIMSQFCNTFGTVARAESGGLNLEAVVTASLIDAGVPSCSIASAGVCTAETTDRFYSYRAEGGLTGRHGAFACLQ